MLPDYVVESPLWGTLYAAGVMAAVIQLVFVAVIRNRRRSNPDGLDVDMLQTVKGPAVLFAVIMGLFLAYLTLAQITHPAFEVIHGREAWAKNLWLIIIIIEFSYLGRREDGNRSGRQADSAAQAARAADRLFHHLTAGFGCGRNRHHSNASRSGNRRHCHSVGGATDVEQFLRRDVPDL